MRKTSFNLIYLLLVGLMLSGCASAEDSSSQASAQASAVESQSPIRKKSAKAEDKSIEGESESQKQNIYSETDEQGIRLEPIGVYGSAPVYKLAFKIKDTNTDTYLKFIHRSKKGIGLSNISINIEPESEFGYWFDSEYTCYVNLCNINESDEIKIRINGLECTFAPRKENKEEQVLDKSIQIKEDSAVIKKAVFYPEYVALYLEESTGKMYENMFLAIDSKGERSGPIVYEQGKRKILVYKKESIMYDNALHLQIGQRKDFKNINIELK